MLEVVPCDADEAMRTSVTEIFVVNEEGPPDNALRLSNDDDWPALVSGDNDDESSEAPPKFR